MVRRWCDPAAPGLPRVGTRQESRRSIRLPFMCAAQGPGSRIALQKDRPKKTCRPCQKAEWGSYGPTRDVSRGVTASVPGSRPGRPRAGGRGKRSKPGESGNARCAAADGLDNLCVNVARGSLILLDDVVRLTRYRCFGLLLRARGKSSVVSFQVGRAIARRKQAQAAPSPDPYRPGVPGSGSGPGCPIPFAAKGVGDGRHVIGRAN